MTPDEAHEKSQQEPEIHMLKETKKEITHSQPRRQLLAKRRSKLHLTLPSRSYSAPKSGNPSTPPLDVANSSPASLALPERSRKRKSNGEIKQMVAELAARADLTMSRGRAVTFVKSRELGYDLPSPGYWDNVWKSNVLRRHPSIMNDSPRSPNVSKDHHPVNGGSKDVEENGKDDNSGKRKRQGSLLEWRHKEMFEEPVRI